MTVGLFVCLAVVSQLEPDSSFVGNWELVALSRDGRSRPGRGLLIVTAGQTRQHSEWIWDLDHQAKGSLDTIRKPGQPWPIIGRHTPSILPGSYVDFGGDGNYRLAGETLIVAIRNRRTSAAPDEDPFRPAPGRTIETYRRVRREPDSSFRPSAFPKGPPTLIATWDEANHGVLNNRPRGCLDHYAAYDLGEGVRLIRSRGTEFLDDPPPADIDPKDVPTGTIVRPPGGKFDDKVYDVTYSDPGPAALAVIDAFRIQNPDVPDRRLSYMSLPPNKMMPEARFLGWDGILLAAVSDGDGTIAQVVFRPRVLKLSSYGTRHLANYSPPLIETWELRGGKLRYLAGGIELGDSDTVSSLIPPDPAPNRPVSPPTRPRPSHLPPVSTKEVLQTVVHYRPARIDLEDSSRNLTDAGAPDPSSPEFTIGRAFYLVPLMEPPAARKNFFAGVLSVPGHRMERWEAVIKSARSQGENIQVEILVWPFVSVFEDGRFRTIAFRPFLETWIYEDYRLRFISGTPASEKNAGGAR